MDNQLLAVIHKYAEDREIDWTSAKVIGEQYGRVFKSEDDLREWKQVIDNYLKTFNADDFAKIEEACKKKVAKAEEPKKKKINESNFSVDEITTEASATMDKWMPEDPDAQEYFYDADLEEKMEMIDEFIEDFFDRFEQGLEPEEVDGFQEFIGKNRSKILKNIAKSH